MDRRFFIAASLGTAALAVPTIASAQNQRPPMRTQWKVRASEGFDALAFLGPLAGGELYLPYYQADVDAFAPRLAAAARAEIPSLSREANDAGFGLLGPVLSLVFSGGDDSSLGALIAAAAAPETRLLPAYRASSHWNEKDWAWFAAHAPRVKAVLEAMQGAGFAAFRAERIAALEGRIIQLQADLGAYDVIRLHEKLTGRTFDPEIEVVLLQFCKPHGIKVQGQTFLQAADWNTAITVRNAAHEMLHPPVVMDGPAAKAALAILAKDPLIPRVVAEHDPKWGYTTLEGLLNEDLAQALDQLIAEELGVARNPSDRWRKSDDGIHILAGAFYGMLRQDKWIETGGSIETWLAGAAKTGRLAPQKLHSIAAHVLERPVDKLWPLA
ncbi:hypothetical protein ATE68_21620 [Sphingopyxis sp. H038]|uniref:hypothetical protein n=1 Tax=unclassified Sphingopyxis TaxID=2614943 RepID=UPI0007307B93|nr:MULTISPECIES: hypothetical protein [unclassified Sphingopyxis]KTD99663.1 hypothetical protein ATE78_22275 [Sphingopyxis sp. H012]KTE05130.1 hypothetical protein ATE76_21715 [Sphingopyxis sp. H093]KTE12366.1 hypothetical protein ATE70_03490 [Sphingopyxis sp. H053]KTE21631.1 hypothetical protein ATE75_20655 [Sphingopyxis sp. H080]KTE31575.1 hypothetical protein ATE68_21620 [Sphingopyxis sp. H038]